MANEIELKPINTGDYGVYVGEAFLGFLDKCEDGLFRFDEASDFWKFLPTALLGIALANPNAFKAVIIKGLHASTSLLLQNCPPSTLEVESGQ